MLTIREEVRQIESRCGGSSKILLKRAEKLSTKLYRTNTRLLLGLQAIGKTNESAKDIVRVQAVKMASIHKIIELDWGKTALGEARFLVFFVRQN